MINEDGSSNIKIMVSHFQLIGNDSTDLLNDLAVFKIGIDKFCKIEMLGLKEVEITSADQFNEIREEAAKKRATATTFKNDTSSRSHAVCRIKL